MKSPPVFGHLMEIVGKITRNLVKGGGGEGRREASSDRMRVGWRLWGAVD